MRFIICFYFNFHILRTKHSGVVLACQTVRVRTDHVSEWWTQTPPYTRQHRINSLDRLFSVWHNCSFGRGRTGISPGRRRFWFETLLVEYFSSYARIAYELIRALMRDYSFVLMMSIIQTVAKCRMGSGWWMCLCDYANSIQSVMGGKYIHVFSDYGHYANWSRLIG